MKYETLSEFKSGTYTSGGTVTYTFTYSNNIDSIRCLYFREGNSIGTVFRITSVTISNNVLTVVLTCNSTIGAATYLFLLATVASY